MSGPHWFAAYVRSRHESRVAERLESRSVESFLPQYKSERKWSDRKIELLMPLFPGYIFVRIDPCEKLRVLEAPGVIRLVGANGSPEQVADEEIEQLKTAVTSGRDPRPEVFISVGSRVVFTRGCLEGYEGILLREKNSHRVVLRMDLINSAMSIEVDADAITPAPNWRQQHSGSQRITA